MWTILSPPSHAAARLFFGQVILQEPFTMNRMLKLLRLDFVPANADVAILVLRTALSVQMLALHGWGKLSNFSTISGAFPDPLHLGHTTSAALAVVGEVVCSLLLMVGLFTRFAALGSAVTMGVAFFLVHQAALSGPQSGELALMYLIGYLSIAIAGPGRFSLDARLGTN
jgi:putative oxidoreductase